jgi:uncharacterized membrane protein
MAIDLSVWGVLSFAVGGAITISAVFTTFSSGPGALLGVILGFAGFLGMGARLDEMLTSSREPRRPQRPLNNSEKGGFVVLAMAVVTLFLSVLIGGFTVYLPIVLLVLGVVLIVLGRREPGNETVSSQS